MKTTLICAAVAASVLLPSIASAQSTDVRVRANVSGEWVLDARKCPDLREDRRDSRVTTSRRDLREDRRDARVIDCPASAYTFVPDVGQAPNQPIRIGNTTVQQKPRGVQSSYQAPTNHRRTYKPQHSAPSDYTINNGRIIFTK